MSGSVENYIKLVEDARNGKIKLPAFQREFKWQRKQVILLFDSVRQGFPLNGMIQIDGNREEFQARPFLGASVNATAQDARKLILDGQQRITAGIHLFYNESEELKSQYFLDLDKLHEHIKDAKVNIESDEEVKQYLADLDADSGYLKARRSSANPYALLIQSHLLFTPLLLSSNAKNRSAHLEEYENRYPDKKALLRNVVNPYFVISGGPSIPLINIESEFPLDAVSRIFATLNSSGKVLTPFELVVAVLYPKGIDLRAEIALGREKYTYYPNMDSTGEIVLQTAVMFDGKSPKKSLLPKTLDAEIWNRHRSEAFKWLEYSGAWLTEHLGMALDKTGSLVPYDSIFAPLAKVLRDIDYDSIPGGSLASTNKKLKRWIVGAAISQRYQEGVHHKQEADVRNITDWIKGSGAQPDWLTNTRMPALTSTIPTGAIGKMMRALINLNNLKDPVNEKRINVGVSASEVHHIFPTKFVSKISGWDKNIDSANRLLNSMQIHEETNKRFLNDDPRLQIEAAEKANPSSFIESYLSQGITEGAISILRKPVKTREDFKAFMKLRESFFEGLLEKLDFESGGAGADEDDDDDA